MLHDSIEILRNVNLHIEGASRTVIRGGSSSGKTTLARIIASVIKPTEGQLTITDGDLHAISFVEQSPTFLEFLSAYDNVLYAAACRGVKKVDAVSQALELFADFGISHLRGRKASDLSCAERAIVAIIRGCIGIPLCIVIDQTIDTLDDANQNNCMLTMNTISSKHGTSIILTTQHSMIEAKLHNCSVYELRDGLLTKVSNLPISATTVSNGEAT